MKKFYILMLAGLLVTTSPGWAESGPVRVKLETSLGDVIMELNGDKAPVTTANFLRYVNERFYNGTVFHRVIKKFMIQGGGLDGELMKKITHAPIKNEADNGLKNKRGAIAMARTGDPHSATSQFFINVKDNPFLDHQSTSAKGWGYCVFGRVLEGMTVVDAIEASATTTKKGRRDVPKTPIFINNALMMK